MGNTPSLMTTNLAYQQWLAESDDSIIFLDKADGGKVTMDDVQGGLKEYERLFKAGLASPAELITLHRAYPHVPKYANVVDILDFNGEDEPTVIGGPASVELVDREGHLITSEALEEAFERYMDNFRTRNVMVMHSDVQVGHALPVYISRGGQIFKSGVEGDNLFFISELRDDTKISKKVKEQINSGKMRSYSIAGSATKTKNISKGADSYMQVDSLELAEVTICEKGVNQGAHFELMKAEQPVPTEFDNNLFVISKEDVPSFTEVFSTWLGKASKEGIVPELNGKQMAVLENGTARQIQHRALLDEMGFPMYVYPENLRHPVDYDEPGCPVPAKIVNQAGQDLGDANIEEMVKSATDTFSNILLKESSSKPAETPVPRAVRTQTSTTYRGELPDHAVPSDVKHKLVEKDVYSERSKLDQIREAKKPTRYHGTVTTRTMSSPGVASQSTGATPTTPPAEKPLSVDISTKSKAVDKGIASTLASLAAGTGEVAGGVAEGIGHLGGGVARGVGHTARGAKEAVFGEDEEKMVKDATDIFANILTQKGVGSEAFGSKDKVTSTAAMRGVDDSPPVTRTRTDFDPKTKTTTREPVVLESAEPVEKIVGELLGAAGKVVGTGIKTVGGAASGAAAGLTGSKQNIDWGGGEKSVDEDDEETSVKKSTDIFKRVLEAERPDETWTGTDKEKEVPMEKIVGALLAPVAGLVGGALGTAGGIAGGAAKKIIGG